MHATIMVWVSLALMVLIVLFAFMPLITIDILGVKTDASVAKAMELEIFHVGPGYISTTDTSFGEGIALLFTQLFLYPFFPSGVLYIMVGCVFLSILMLVLILINVLLNIKKCEIGASKVAFVIPTMIAIPLLIQMSILGMMNNEHINVSFAIGLKAICIISILFILFGAVLTRFRGYQFKQLKYLNIIQAVSAVSIICLVVFIYSIIKGEFFSWCINLSSSGTSSLYHDEYAATMFNAFLAFFALCGIGAYGVLLGTRISCTMFNPKLRSKKKRVDSGLGTSIALLLIVVFAIISGNDQVLSSEKIKYFAIAIVAMSVALVTEIALKVLTHKYCRGLSVAEMNTIVCGFETVKEDNSKAKKNQNKNKNKK